MIGANDNGFVDLIYGAAVDPALWEPVMERYAEMVGGAGTWLSQLDMIDGSGADPSDPCTGLDPDWLGRYAAYFADRNPLSNVDNPQEYLRQWTPKILTDEDWMPKADLVRSEFYNDFLKPLAAHSSLMVRLATAGNEIATLNILRPEPRGQFEARDLEIANHYHPHLVRAFDLGRKIAPMQRLSGEMNRLLNLSPHGLLLLDGHGRVLHANRAGEDLLAERDAFCLIGGRLSAAGASGRVLTRLIASAASHDREHRAGGSMALSTSSRCLPLSITVAPIRHEASTPFRMGATVIVCVTDLEAGVSLPEQKLRDLFGLTPAETRVALALFEGASPRDAAEAFGVSLNTVQAHLARIFDKTGSRKQSDLVRLMMRAAGVELG